MKCIMRYVHFSPRVTPPLFVKAGYLVSSHIDCANARELVVLASSTGEGQQSCE